MQTQFYKISDRCLTLRSDGTGFDGSAWSWALLFGFVADLVEFAFVRSDSGKSGVDLEQQPRSGPTELDAAASASSGEAERVQNGECAIRRFSCTFGSAGV